MAATNFELKEYQRISLDRLTSYLRDTAEQGADLAFYKATKFPFRNAPAVAQGTPYVCLRVPTGGGKTLLAAHSIGIAARELLTVANPMVLWLVPSTAILDQTIEALKTEGHPYRAALARDFNRNFTVMTKTEALAMSRADATGGAVVIVTTIQSFRREDDSGKENPEGLKVYEDAGALMDHFASLTEEQKAPLDLVEGTSRPVASLANLLRLHRPMVIVDEAHNSRSDLSFRTLARFSPSLILELTATPQTEHKPERGQHASNILYAVSAAELKAEEMIKMPIRLTTDGEWAKTVGAALDCQRMLEEAAKAEEAETGEYIRPIILFQAQSASKTDPTRLTWETIEKHLMEDQRIPKDQIAVHTGPRKDLDGIDDIRDPKCPVRYIITVSKLKEGWDCPFAYVLCSVADQVSPVAVEQILGRILRMPQAKRKRRDALNQSYAYIVSRSFDTTAQQLKTGLVEGAGFNRLEADDIVAPQQNLGFSEEADTYQHQSDPLPEETAQPETIIAAIAKLPPSVKTRVSFDADTRTLSYSGPMTRESRNLLHLGLASVPQVGKAIDRLYAKTNNFQTSAADDEDKPPFIVPMLGFRKQGELQLFSQEHFLDLPWRLDACDVSDIKNRFRPSDTSRTGTINVSDKGKVEINFINQLQGQLAGVVREPTWTLPRLANWLDSGIVHPDITKPSAVVFISKAIEDLVASGIALDVLARNKYDLRKALAQFIKDLRGERETSQYSALFAANAEDFQTSADLSIIFDEQSHAPNRPYSGATKFNKHYFSLIGAFDSDDERDCALHIDRHEKVRYWVRNIDRKRSSFWLQLPHGKFYPDFIVMLTDGRILVVEYKGEHLYEGEAVKRQIGTVWADASNGNCLFCMPTARDFALIDRTLD
ncbi:DEAD/DEAH box helicase family protein [Litorivita sp. NS0012-18]|uniref:DEAD/DEAH box helicase n=1 Tax=Litorivita sp. NS0012-18 TaxID=3127655 RepID=UPI003108BB53